MKPDIDCLKNLHSGQLHQLCVFIEDLGYRKAAERASEEFNQPIHKTALQRYMRRLAPAEFLEETPENEEASRQILKFAADGQPDFTATTVRALEKLVFQLTLTCTSIDDDMNALTKISTMLCRFRNTATRERMATVQEGKLKLRQQQLEKANNPNDDDKKIADLNERIAQAFSLHPVLTAIRQAEEATLSHNPNLTPNPNPDFASEATSDPESSAVPPKNESADCGPEHHSAAALKSHPLSVKSAPSAVLSSFSTPIQNVENQYEIRNHKS